MVLRGYDYLSCIYVKKWGNEGKARGEMEQCVEDTEGKWSLILLPMVECGCMHACMDDMVHARENKK